VGVEGSVTVKAPAEVSANTPWLFTAVTGVVVKM
jgi:hypothetical protein